MAAEPVDPVERLRAAGAARGEVLGGLLQEHRLRLLHMVELRMDRRLRARLGASDVVQDALLEASRRVDAYLADPRMPFFLWLRFLAAQRLVALHRHHVVAQRRDARRDMPLEGGAFPPVHSEAMAEQLSAGATTPSEGVQRAETQRSLADALERLSPEDREVLALRHFEELSNVEAARELGIAEPAASKRYVRALVRLREVLGPDMLLDEEASG